MTGSESEPSRADAARDRVNELRARLVELTQGQPVSPGAVAHARQRAADALVRAQRAHEAAASRHGEASEKHRRAAAAHEQAALTAPDDEVDGHLLAAQRHRDAAERHDAEAAAQLTAEAVDARRRVTSADPSATRRH